MSVALNITHTDDCVVATVSGFIETIDEVIDYMRQAKAAAEKWKLQKILTDYMEARFDLDFHDLILLAERGAALDFQKNGFRIASIVQPDALDFHKKFEIAAINRSFTYASFVEYDEAQQWLGKE